jgi:hypothetical protein
VKLWDALKRSHLVSDTPVGSKNPSLDISRQSVEGRDSQPKFTLDSPVEDEGGNLSIGQVREC